jgi:hypothetical protein
VLDGCLQNVEHDEARSQWLVVSGQWLVVSG